MSFNYDKEIDIYRQRKQLLLSIDNYKYTLNLILQAEERNLRWKTSDIRRNGKQTQWTILIFTYIKQK